MLKSIPAYLPIVNIDTDMIIPKQFLKTIKRTGLGKNLFYEMRYDQKGDKINNFILNSDPYNNSKILIAGKNFGCGSSREHAPWALLDFGITCVISSSFADIFYNNCFKNGILPIALSEEEIYKLFEDFKFVIPQGSPLSGIGNPFQVQSLSNCFVIDSAQDSYAGILHTDQEQVQIMKRRGGVGHDVSNIRPRGMPTKNAARNS